MFNSKVANEADSYIRAIHDELLKSEELLNEKIVESALSQQQIPIKEQAVLDLEEQLESLSESTKESHERVNSLTKEKEALIAQNSVLRQLSSYLQENVNENDNGNLPELSEEEKNQINFKVEEFFSTLNQEFEPHDILELQEELRRVKEQRRSLESEISVLKQVSGDWRPNDGIEYIMGDYEERISVNPSELRVFHSSNFSSNNPSLLECSASSDSQSSTKRRNLTSSADIEAEICSIRATKERNSDVYKNQLEFLSHLKEATEAADEKQMRLNDTKLDPNSLENIKIEGIKPLSIPEPKFDVKEAESTSRIISEFKEYTEGLIDQLPTNIFEEVVNAAEQNLDIPEYSSPQVNLTCRTEASRGLAQLSKELKNAENATAVELPEQLTYTPHSVTAKQTVVKDRQRQEIEEIDNSNVENLIRIARNKLPAATLRGLDRIEAENEEEVREEKEEEEKLEVIHSEEIMETINNFHTILERLSKLELPTDTALLRPQKVPKTTANIESLDREEIISTVENILSPQQEIARNLEIERRNLEKKVVEINKKLEIEQNKEESKIVVTDEEINDLEARYRLLEMRLRRLTEKQN